ncbi:MAG: hypothetical protein GY859_15965 [Desulfobacterales bacterium]|nr:hypothetical protein [Desulfobacterales bacterium]
MYDIRYTRPDSLEEALEFLHEHGGETTILAGGTDVTADLKSGEIREKNLLDVSRLKALQGVGITGEGLRVGAGVTLSEIYTSQTIGRHAPALQKCAFTFGSRQIRNVATIGGNAARCSPCGDTAPPLLIHEARAVLASKTGRREVPVEEIASGPYTRALPADELIVRFILKPAADMDHADFRKIGRRKALSIARINMAVMLRKGPGGRVERLRFSMGACTPTPRRFRVVEEHLTGQPLTEARIWEAGERLTDQMLRVADGRPSADYKAPAIQGLLLKMLHPMV